MEEYLRKSLARQKVDAEAKATFDAATENLATFDAASEAYDFATKNTRMTAAAAVQGWVEMDPSEMEEGATLIDGFFGMLSAAVDTDSDGELSDEEAEAFEEYVDSAWDYLITQGVSEADAEALIEDEDVEAATRIRELLMESLGDDDEASMDAVEFGMTPCPPEGTKDMTFDGVSWAKTHRGRTTLNSKHGKKNLVQHRRKWRKATAMQRASLRKNSRRAHTSAAKMLNRKSNRRTRMMGGRRVV